MSQVAKSYSDHIYTALRVVAGLLFALHGSQKLLGFPGGVETAHGGLLLAAGLIELAGGALIALGLLTRPVAFLASGTMAVAYFMAHAPHGFYPILNQGELAALYSFLFLYVFAHGGGRFSLDALGATHRMARAG
jgi:putative oxidoreductase